MTENFFLSNKDRILNFGERFLELLDNDERTEETMKKDPEKLARIMKLLFEQLDNAAPKEENTAVTAILRAFSEDKGGDD